MSVFSTYVSVPPKQPGVFRKRENREKRCPTPPLHLLPYPCPVLTMDSNRPRPPDLLTRSILSFRPQHRDLGSPIKYYSRSHFIHLFFFNFQKKNLACHFLKFDALGTLEMASVGDWPKAYFPEKTAGGVGTAS